MMIGPRPGGSRAFETLFECGAAGAMSDGHLLDRFVSQGDGLAFEALVLRHGSMVLRECRRVLDDRHEAEDAFQATFLVLARKAGSVRARDSVGPWLRGVAARVAAKARAGIVRRDRRSRDVAEVTAREARCLAGSDEEGREIARLIREEIGRLPAIYRKPVELCYFDGLTCEQAAARLRRPVGTVTVQLARARDRLRRSLVRRGVSAGAGLLGSILTGRAGEAAPAIPRSLIASTIQAATPHAAGGAALAGSAPAHVAALAEGAITAMFSVHLKVASALAVGGVAAVVLISARPAGPPAPAGEPAAIPGRAAVVGDDKDKTEGDKLRGRWQCSSLEGGRGKSEGKGSEADQFKLSFDGDGYVFEGAFGLMGGDAKGKFKLGPEKSPKHLDLESDKGPMIGIYKLEGDTLTISLNKIGLDDRPTDFTPGESRFIWVFTREAP